MGMIQRVGERGGNGGGTGRMGQEWEWRAEGGFLSGGIGGLDKMGREQGGLAVQEAAKGDQVCRQW